MRGPVSLLRSPWTEAFDHLLAEVEDDLFLAAPFVKVDVAERVALAIHGRNAVAGLKVQLATDLRTCRARGRDSADEGLAPSTRSA